MNLFLRWTVKAYTRILSLYPRGLREEFADEMKDAFGRVVMEAAEEGTLNLLLVCGREFAGLLFDILQESLYEFQRAQANMHVSPVIPMQPRPGSWKGALWAALPHLLLALLVGLLTFFINTKLENLSGILIAVTLAAGFLATIYFTWRFRRPAWRASWYGYAGLMVFLFATLPPQGWQLPLDRFVGGMASILLLLLSLAALLYWLSRRNPIEGLLLALPVIILYWLVITEFIPSPLHNWLIAGLFLVAALTAMIVIRINSIQKAIWIVLAASVLGGLPIAYARTYLHNIREGHFLPPSLGQMVELFSIQFLAGAALSIGPVLGWGIWNLGKRNGAAGRISSLLVIFGVLLNLLGQFSYWRWFSHMGFFDALGIPSLYRPDATTSIFMVNAGLIVTLIGAILLTILLRRWNSLLSISLILVPLVLPLLAMCPIYFGFHIFPAGLSFEFGYLSQTYKSLFFLIGMALLGAGAWSVTRLYQQPAPLEGIA